MITLQELALEQLLKEATVHSATHPRAQRKLTQLQNLVNLVNAYQIHQMQNTQRRWGWCGCHLAVG